MDWPRRRSGPHSFREQPPTMTPNINDMRDRQSGVFGSLQHGCAVVGRASVALVILFTAGCAKDATKKKAGGDRAAKLEASATAKAGATSAAQKTQSSDVWRPRLGKILVVKEKLEFVLIDIGTAPAPEAGTKLLAYTDSNPSAELVVSAFQKRPFLIADIVSGEPKVGDAVAADVTPKARPPAAASRNSEQAPMSALSGDEPPKLGPSKSRPGQSPKESAVRDPFRAPGSPEPRFGPEDTQSGEGIIPGLPPRSFR